MWHREITPEVFTLSTNEGWDVPANAQQVRNLGERLHHREPIVENQLVPEAHTERVWVRNEQRCTDQQVLSHYRDVRSEREDCTDKEVYSHSERVEYEDGTAKEKDVFKPVRECVMVPVTTREPVYITQRTCTTEAVYEDQPGYHPVWKPVTVGDRPVYRPWFEWSTPSWVAMEPVAASGVVTAPASYSVSQHQQPHWPDWRSILPDTSEGQRKFREGRRMEKLSLRFRDASATTQQVDNVAPDAWHAACRRVGQLFQLQPAWWPWAAPSYVPMST